MPTQRRTGEEKAQVRSGSLLSDPREHRHEARGEPLPSTAFTVEGGSAAPEQVLSPGA